MTIDQQVTRNINPNMELGFNSTGFRYPNQFFDLSQQYMPPTIKELFRWCTFYYYNSPLIGSAIKKVSRYPVTDLILEDASETVKDFWKKLLVEDLKIKDRLMEINLDAHAYGNCFVSVHFPFTRFLVCKECRYSAPISNWDWQFKGGDIGFHGNCKRCGKVGYLDAKDIPYKSHKGIKIIRWNPENINLKFNEFTGRYTYMYSVPFKIKRAIERGDKDIIEDMPLLVIEAVRKRRLIRLNPDNIFHIKMPTLAEQDQGWGKPHIIHVLKDMFYFYTLRRAQEAIALEHIVPFDMIYPVPNAQQDPYVHTDLSSWRFQIESIIKKHRRDPNFKAVLPVPVGHGRLGGDGKALMLSPELNYLTQTVVGGMGLPQEFLFGGLNYTGSSISLRTLENDFVQNRSQLLDFVIWLKDKIRIYLHRPDIKGMRFADFRMADDIQRNQQLIGLNAQGKVSNATMLTELGYNYEEETKKLIEEIFMQNYVQDMITKGSAKSQGEASIISYNYQQKIQEMVEKAQKEAKKKMDMEMANQPITDNVNSPTPDAMQDMGPGQAPMAPQQPPPGMYPPPGPAEGGGQPPMTPVDEQIHLRVENWAAKLMQMEPNTARMTIGELKTKLPNLGYAVEESYNAKMRNATQSDVGAESEGQGVGDGSQPTREGQQMMDAEMTPLPMNRAPTRGSVTGGR